MASTSTSASADNSARKRRVLGMLRKVKDEVAWTKADASIVKELLEKRGRMAGYKPITKPDLPKDTIVLMTLHLQYQRTRSQ